MEATISDIRTRQQIVWLLYGLVTITVLSPFVGLLLAYLWRASFEGEPLAGHFSAQFILFQRAAIGWTIGICLLGIALHFNKASVEAAPADDHPLAFNLGIFVILLTQIFFVIASFSRLCKATKSHPKFRYSSSTPTSPRLKVYEVMEWWKNVQATSTRDELRLVGWSKLRSSNKERFRRLSSTNRALLVFMFAFSTFNSYPLATSVSAEEPTFPMVVDASPRVQTGAWDDMCKKLDCDQFPAGYQTFDFNGERYYFPLPHVTAQGERFAIGRSTLVGLGGSKEINEQGQITRIYAKNTQHIAWGGIFSSTLPVIQSHMGLTIQADLEPYWLSLKGRIQILPSLDSDRLQQNRVYSLLNRTLFRRPEPGNEIDPAQIPSDMIQGEIEKFWILKYQFPNTRLWMVSKEPMLLGRHLFVECNLYCDFTTLRYGDERDRKYLTANLSGLIGSKIHPTKGCRDEVQVEPELCHIYNQQAEHVVEYVDLVLKVFEAAKIHPDLREPK